MTAAKRGEWYNHSVSLLETGVPTSSEISAPLASSGVIFENDYSFHQTQFMGHHSGILFTEQGQLDLYRTLRLRDKRDSDQVVYARVLARTGGPVDAFKAKHPNISFPSGLELENY